MTLAVRVLLGLLAGTLLGLALAGSQSPVASSTLAVLAPVGTLFVDLIRMTAMPLVVSLLIASVGGMSAAGGLGRTAARTAVLAVTLLVAASVGSMLVAQPVLGWVSVTHAAASAASAPAPPAPVQPPGFAQWLSELVTPNVVKAAADGAMLPVILFAVLFALALARASESRREAVVLVAEGVAETMQRLVGWILAWAPVGVFALAVPLAARMGFAAAGAVAAYIGLVVTLTIAAVVLLLYPLGIVAGRMSAAEFVAYCAPSQALAFASRSSLATTPAMMASAERAGLPAPASRVVLPVAVSVFHFGSAVAQTVGVLFLARLYDVVLTPPQLATIAVTVVLTSFAVPGIPGGSIIAIVPVLTAANVPIEGVGILLAVDTIPDMFRTTANVTGALTLAAVRHTTSE